MWSAILEVNPLATPTRGIPYQAVVGPEYASPAGLLPLGLPQNEVSTRAGQLHNPRVVFLYVSLRNPGRLTTSLP